MVKWLISQAITCGMILGSYYLGVSHGEAKINKYYEDFYKNYSYRPRLSRVSLVVKNQQITKEMDFYENSIAVSGKDDCPHGGCKDLTVDGEIRLFYNGGVWLPNKEAREVERYTNHG